MDPIEMLDLFVDAPHVGAATAASGGRKLLLELHASDLLFAGGLRQGRGGKPNHGDAAYGDNSHAPTVAKRAAYGGQHVPKIAITAQGLKTPSQKNPLDKGISALRLGGQ
jgi:hypothetical protein